MTDHQETWNYWFRLKSDLSWMERQKGYDKQIRDEEELDRKYPYRGPEGQRLTFEELGLYYS